MSTIIHKILKSKRSSIEDPKENKKPALPSAEGTHRGDSPVGGQLVRDGNEKAEFFRSVL